MKDPILCECEECGDIALEAAYGGRKCAGCMLDAVDDPVVIDSVGRAIAMLLQDVVREHGPKRRDNPDDACCSDSHCADRRAPLSDYCKKHSLPGIAKHAPIKCTREGCSNDAATGCLICDQCVRNDMRNSGREAYAKSVFERRHGVGGNIEDVIKSLPMPSEDEVAELVRMQARRDDALRAASAARLEAGLKMQAQQAIGNNSQWTQLQGGSLAASQKANADATPAQQQHMQRQSSMFSSANITITDGKLPDGTVVNPGDVIAAYTDQYGNNRVTVTRANCRAILDVADISLKHTCSTCSAETTHAVSCGCGKCYGCCES